MVYDALIIGGGPAGATIAFLLANAGWSVAIVEKKTFPRRKVCGEFMSATNLPLLQNLGLAEFYRSHGGPEIRRVGLFAEDAIVVSAMPQTNVTNSHWGRALGREHLDTILLNKAVNAGATLWQPWCVTNLQRHADSYACTIACEQETKQIMARVIIKANGSWEQDFEPIKTYPHKPFDLLAFKAHFKASELEADTMPLLVFPGGYGGLVNTDGGRVTLSCCIRRDTLQKVRKQNPGIQAGEAVLRHIFDSCRGVREVLAHAEREGSWLAAGPIRPGIRKRYENGIFYVGNIAGEAHPVVAEGISMALQAAWLLSEVLLKRQDEVMAGNDLAAAGKEYSEQWSAHFANRIHAANVFAQLAMRPWVVAVLLPIIKRFPSILTLGAKLSGKINQVVAMSLP